MIAQIEDRLRPIDLRHVVEARKDRTVLIAMVRAEPQ
jgi:hypothetical protein